MERHATEPLQKSLTLSAKPIGQSKEAHVAFDEIFQVIGPHRQSIQSQRGPQNPLPTLSKYQNPQRACSESKIYTTGNQLLIIQQKYKCCFCLYTYLNMSKTSVIVIDEHRGPFATIRGHW